MKSTIHEHKKQIKMNVSKKAITLFTICLLLIAGTQTTQAQTKEETIAWIKEKLEKYAYSNVTPLDWSDIQPYQAYCTNIEITPCSISYTLIGKNKQRIKNEQESTMKISFPLDATYKNNDLKKFIMFESNAAIVKYSGMEPYHGKYINGSIDYFILANNEENLGERFLKALNHLATFCEKKKEAF